jgi:hypothetical protein
VVASLVLVEGDDVIEEDLMILLTRTEEFQIGRVDGFGFLIHFVTRSERDHDAAIAALSTEVPNVTGILTHDTKHGV